MRFGPVPVAEAGGAILAHSESVGGRKLAKGTVLGEEDLAALTSAGLSEVTVAQLDLDDIPENDAAQALAQALVPLPEAASLTLTAPHAGRVNLKAVGPGVVMLDPKAIHRLNRIDPVVTLATLPPFQRVAKGTLVGTVKIITYAVPDRVLTRAQDAAREAIRVQPVQLGSAGLILTQVPGQATRLNDKGRQAIEGRLRALGMDLADCISVPHDRAEMARALQELAGDMVLILTGSATSDPMDVAPQAVRDAGGTVARFGMPVDPGNLLFHGMLGARPVIGLPGCARSPALNGADWVLDRIACGLSVTDDDIATMGLGGLLKEIPIRPQLRDG